MKTVISKQKISKALSLIATSLMVVLAMTGCGKKNGNNNQPVVTPFGFGACGNGCTAGSLIASAYGTTGLEDFYVHFVSPTPMNNGVNGGMVGGTNMNNASYQGQAFAQGSMIVNQDSLMCGLVRGPYTIIPNQSGVSGAIQGQSVVQTIVALANGPQGQIQLEFTPRVWINSAPARQGPDGAQYAYRLNGTVVVRGINGRACAIEIY